LYLSKQESYNTLNNKIMPLKVLNDSMFVKPCNFLNMDSTVKVRTDSESLYKGLTEYIRFNFVSFKTKKL
jgi:hypothetical protein